MVCYTAVFSVVTQRSSPLGALRDDTKNGRIADYHPRGMAKTKSEISTQDKMNSKRLYLILCQKKNVREQQMPYLLYLLH